MRPRGSRWLRTTCGFRPSGSRRSSAARQTLEVGDPDRDEGADGVLEASFARDSERLLPALTRLRGIDALLQPVVSRDKKLLDTLVCVLPLHKPSLTGHISLAGLRGPSSVAAIRVLIADDQRLFAEALEAILGGDDRIEVVAHAGNGKEAARLARELEPDVILMDISMPVLDGIQATREIRKRDDTVSILMLTGSNSRADVDRERKAGASGYVTKDRIAAELIEAIVEIASRR